MTDASVGPDPRWLTPGVAGIGVASFFSDVSQEIPSSLLPRLLTSTLGAPASALGVIEGVSDGLAGVAKLAGGALADDPARRRNIAVGGYTVTAALSAATGGATATWQVGVLRAGAWSARGLRSPARSALLADAVPRSAYGRAYGFERAMDNLGAIVGPLAAIALVAALGSRRAIAVSIVPGLIAAACIVYAIRHTAVAEAGERRPLRLRVRPVLAAPGMGRLLGAVSAFEVANVAATLLILRATELLEPGRSTDRATTAAIGLYAAYNLAATLVSVPAGRHVDRTSAPRVLTAGVALFAVAYAGFAAGPASVAGLAPWFLLAGAGIACVETAEQAAVATAAPLDLRGSAFGLLAVIQSAGNLLASAVAGLLWSAVSAGAAFEYLTAWMVVAAVLLGRSLRDPGPGAPAGAPVEGEVC